MAFNRNHARRLCTAAEYQIFAASLQDEIVALTPAGLRGKIQRARNLRDKYRDLFKRQRLANRARTGSKKGEHPNSNARTEAKAKMFDEALARFEARAAKLSAAAERETRREAKQKAAQAALKARVAKVKKAGAQRVQALAKRSAKGDKAAVTTGYTSESARVAARDKHSRDTRSAARKGHNSAAGKRSQARRDRRG